MTGGPDSMTGNAANDAAVAAAAAAGFSLQSHNHPGSQLPDFSNASFSPQFNFAAMPGSTPAPGASDQGQGRPQTPGGGYDPMFGTMPTNPFGSPAPWQGEDGGVGGGMPKLTATAHSPGDRSQNGSAGTGPGEEKDPFLSFLEQLAENEFARGPGHEMDFFLGGQQSSG